MKWELGVFRVRGKRLFAISFTKHPRWLKEPLGVHFAKRICNNPLPMVKLAIGGWLQEKPQKQLQRVGIWAGPVPAHAWHGPSHAVSARASNLCTLDPSTT